MPPGEATTASVPAARRLGVVLTDPSIDDRLNVRDEPGTQGQIVGKLLPTQSRIRPTGRQETVDGSIWHEVEAGETLGWVHGRYVTELWTSEVIEETWDWETALDAFADAMAGGEDLAEVVSWRGLYVIHHDDNLRRWKPDALSGLLADNTKLAWASTGASAEERGPTASFREQIAERFLADYRDEDVRLELGGLPLGAGATLPEAAISPAFGNFVWVAVHDPIENPDYGGLDWSTWFVFMELEDTSPKVVGLQIQTSYP